MRHSSNPVVNMFSESFVRVPAPCIALVFLACCGSLVADPIVIAPGNGVSTNVVTLYSGETELSVNPGASEGGIVTLNKWNMHTGGTSLGCGTLVMTGAGEMGQASPVGTGAFSPGAGTVRYIGPAGGVFYANVAPSFASDSTSACVFDVQNDLTYSGAWNQPYGGFIKTGPGVLSIVGKSNSTNWFGASSLTGTTGVFTDAMLAKKLVFNANGDAPAEGFGAFSVVEGTFRIDSGVNVFGTGIDAAGSQIGAWTTDEGTEKGAVLEIAGGQNLFIGRTVVGKQNGGATTGGDDVHTGVRVTGGETMFNGKLILGWNGDTTAFPSLDSRPFYEQTGGTVTLGGNLQLGYTNTKGVQATVAMMGGTLDVNGKNIVSGYQATYTTNTIDVSGTAGLVGANNFYVHNGSSNGAGNKLDINVHDGGTLGFTALYSNNNTTKTHLRVDGGVLRNDKSDSNASATTLWIGNATDGNKRLTSFKIGPKGATFCSKNGNSSGVAQVYSQITAEPAGGGETAAGVSIASGRIAFCLPMEYEGPTTVKNGGFLYLFENGALPASSVVTVEGGGMLRLMGTDKTISSLTLGDNATLGFGTPSSGANSSVLTVSGDLVLPANAKISLYTKSDVTGDKKLVNGTYSVLKVPVSYAASLRAVKWFCTTLTTGNKFATFAVAEDDDFATLSVTIADAPEEGVCPAGTVISTNGNLSVSGDFDVCGTLKVQNSVYGSADGGSITVKNGGVLDVSNGNVVPSNAVGNSFNLYLENGSSLFVKNIQTSDARTKESTWDDDPYFHFDGGTVFPLYTRGNRMDDEAGWQLLLNYQKATLGEHGLTIDLSKWTRPATDPQWIRVSIQGRFVRDTSLGDAGADGGIVVKGCADDKLAVYFGGRMCPSTFKGAIQIEDGCVASSISYALVDLALEMKPGSRLQPFFNKADSPIPVQVGSLTLGAEGASKPVGLFTSNMSSLLGGYVVSNAVSVLSPVEFGTCANWYSDLGISVGVFTTLVYRSTYSVNPERFQLSADATADGYALSAEEVTIDGGDYAGWHALVCTVSAGYSPRHLVVTGSDSYPSPVTVSTDSDYGEIIVGGTRRGEEDPCSDTSLTISGNVRASKALYLGYNARAGIDANHPHQGFLSIGSGASLSVPAVYSAYQSATPSENPRYGCELAVNGGQLNVSGDVRFSNNISKSGDKLYSQLTVDNGGRVTVGGTFYLYYYQSTANTGIPGCIVLNDGDVDVKGPVDLSRNSKVNTKTGGAHYDSILYHFGLYLNGGVLKAENIMMSNAAAVPKVYFNGTTFMPYGKSAENRTMQNLNKVYVSTNGAIVSTANMPAGSTYTIAQQLLTDPALNGAADGGFTKRGANTLVLSGANTFTGPVRVEEGALVAQNDDAISGVVDVELGEAAALVLGDGKSSATFNSITASGMVAGNVTVTNRIDASDGLYLTVGGALTIDRRTTVDFGLEPGAAPSSAWIPVATASGDIDVPGRVRAVNCGEGMPHCKMFVADKVVYMRPAAPMLMLMVR